MRTERQRSQPLTGRRKDCIAHRGRDRWHAGLPDATRRGVARHDVDVDLRRLMQTQHTVLVEIPLLRAPILERDVAPQRGRQAKNDAALELRRHDTRIHDLPTVDHTRDFVDLESAAVDRNFRNLGDERRIAFHESESLVAARGRLPQPERSATNLST